MATYIISYDLVKSEDYAPLAEKLKSLGQWAKVVESTWIIVSGLSCTEIRDSISDVVDDSSKIIVVESASVGAWKNVLCSNEWLKANL